jgi:UDP-glucose 4-epimerase
MVAVVTGAFGFLGRHIAAALTGDGWRVVGTGRPEVEIPSAEFDALLDGTNAGLVVHCAGPASVPASVEDPAADFRGSVGVLFDVLERLRGRDTGFVLVSSAAVYGEPERLPVAESTPIRPISPYGFHRAVCELLVREFHELWGLRCCTLRIFSAYGEGLHRQIMWDICRGAVRDGTVALHGTGEESRDFVHASDVARAVALVARSAPLQAEVYNVATGSETSITTVARLLLDALGSEAPLSFLGRTRPGDPRHWRADVGRLADLGYSPSVPLEEGVRAYAAWAQRELRR